MQSLVTTSVFLLAAASLFGASSLPKAVSVPDPRVVLPLSGNGDSTAPVISADGRLVLFVSAANNLVVGDNSQQGLDIFLRDRASNTTVLVSANLNGTGGGNGSSMFPGMSADGRYVVFESDASDLVPGDTNGVGDVFVRDLLSGTTKLVSVATDGGPGNGPSSDAAMTPDGRYVAFISSATNLVAGDTNKIPDVFVRDLITQTTLLASVSAVVPVIGGTCSVSSVSITPDGRFVSFFSTAAGLAAGVTNRPVGEVYVRDMTGGVTIWASTNGASLAQSYLGLVNPPSYHPVVSDDGRFVAFKTGSTNGGGWVLVLQYDASNQTTEVVNTNGVPSWAFSDDLYGPEMTPDGRFVAFAQREGPTNSLHSSLHLWDNQLLADTLISADTNGAGSTTTLSRTPALSPDGRFVAFISDASNLVTNSLAEGSHVYLRDTLLNNTILIDADTNGVATTDSTGAVPVITTNGQFVAWSGPDGALVAGDNNGWLDVLIRNVTNGSTELISINSPAETANTGDGLSSLSQFSISADGRWLIYASASDNLVLNDTNKGMDIFLRDLAAGTTTLVSAGASGVPALGGDSSWPVISASGRFAAFVSGATNLVSSPVPPALGYNQVFRQDLLAGTNVLVTLDPAGTSPGSNDSFSPLISEDGRYITFLSRAQNLVSPSTSGGLNVFWRDVDGGTTVALTTNGQATIAPSLSADGRFVAWFSAATRVTVRDMQLGTNLYTTPVGAGSAALSPSGNLLAWQGAGQINIADVAAQSNRFSYTSSIPVRSSAQWSGNSRYLAFVSGAKLLGADSNGTNDVYLCDAQTGALTLLSLDFTSTTSANGPSDWPVVNRDASFVAFRSFATNILAGRTNTPSLYVFSRFSGTNLLLGASQPVSGSLSWLAWPAISADGGVVSFKSWATGLVPNDLNRVPDVFENLVDSDGDGIPDWWMIQYFGHPTGMASDASRPQDDFDHDGMSNLQEYIAGTDPTKAGSIFKIQMSFVVATNGVVLSWPATSASSYLVQFKNNLADVSWQNASGNPSVISGQAVFGVPADQLARFYRIIATR